MAFPLKHNLLRDDYVAVAEHVSECLHKYGSGRLFVAPDGGVRVVPLAEDRQRPDSELVGTYSKGYPVELIEGDLIDWLQERTRSAA